MNWKRIWTGAAIAALFIMVFDFFVMHLTSRSGLLHVEGSVAIQTVLDGFFCSFLYVVFRPRLGPGPKTAILVGTCIYLLKHGLGLVWILLRTPAPGAIVAVLALAWVKLVSATYLAGWQYIEKAP